MNRRRLLSAVLSLTVAGAVILSGIAWWHRSRTQAAYGDAALLGDIATIDVCGTALRLLDRGEEDKAKLLLQLRINSSLKNSQYLIGMGATVPPNLAIPNLRESLNRLAQYARDKKDDDMAAQIGRLLASLQPS